MALLTSILIGALIAIIFILFNSLVLWLISDKILKFVVNDWKTGFKVAGFAGIVSYILGLISIAFSDIMLTIFSVIALVINTIILIWLIRKYYRVDIKEAVFMWAIDFVVLVLLGILVGLLLGFFWPQSI